MFVHQKGLYNRWFGASDSLPRHHHFTLTGVAQDRSETKAVLRHYFSCVVFSLLTFNSAVVLSDGKPCAAIGKRIEREILARALGWLLTVGNNGSRKRWYIVAEARVSQEHKCAQATTSSTTSLESIPQIWWYQRRRLADADIMTIQTSDPKSQAASIEIFPTSGKLDSERLDESRFSRNADDQRKRVWRRPGLTGEEK
ncbi:hypothetical protein TNCV_2499491 [Trichonephila clavipes]|nr:hypothetical protein TNCV_2499491 [Trichonephila clavipes]